MLVRFFFPFLYAPMMIMVMVAYYLQLTRSWDVCVRHNISGCTRSSSEVFWGV
jgi:hypothetical protein